MAGTGKSTIARTAAQAFATRGELGGTFFFKRGEPNRGKANQLFSTIAVQLANFDHGLRGPLAEVIRQDSLIFDKVLAEQFKQLVLGPLTTLNGEVSRLIVVILDALDESEGDEQIKIIIRLLIEAKNVRGATFKILVTSRPELPIRLGFARVQGSYESIALHDIPRSTIERDIALFLQYRLSNIRDDYNLVISDDQRLPSDWPGITKLKALVKMAVPLFIVATTMCFFLEDPVWFDPQGQLDTLLDSPASANSVSNQLAATYRPILDKMLLAHATTSSKARLIAEFQYIVGTIILLAEPLSSQSLARLLNLPKSSIDRKLSILHSVVDVPSSSERSIRLMHLSFRDYLVESCLEENPFVIDESTQHTKITLLCFRLLSENGLKRDICDLQSSDTSVKDINSDILSKCIPLELRYACLYWVFHLEKGRETLDDSHPVYNFLVVHFLHWLEALSILQRLSESLGMIDVLQRLVSTSAGVKLLAFLQDARKFVLKYRFVVTQYPLQLYCSALIFAPRSSTVRVNFETLVPSWVSLAPITNESWQSYSQILVGSQDSLSTSLTFSKRDNSLVSASWDGLINFWNTTTGTVQQTIQAQQGVWALCLLADDSQCLTVSRENLQCWEIATGSVIKSMRFEKSIEDLIFLAPSGTRLVDISLPGNIRLWDISLELDSPQLIMEDTQDFSWRAAFSPDSSILAIGKSRSVHLLDAITGQPMSSHWNVASIVTAMTFSPIEQLLAVACGGDIVICDLSLDEKFRFSIRVNPHIDAMNFAPHNSLLAIAGRSQVWLIDMGSRASTQISIASSCFRIAFSPDWRTFAISSANGTIELYDTYLGAESQPAAREWLRSPNIPMFSPDGKVAASFRAGGGVQLWEAETGQSGPQLVQNNERDMKLSAFDFSYDSKILASCQGDQTLSLWDVDSGAHLQDITTTIEARSVAFSTVGPTIALGSESGAQVATIKNLSGRRSAQLIPLNDLEPRQPMWNPTFSLDEGLIISRTYGHLLFYNLDKLHFLSKDRNAQKRSMPTQKVPWPGVDCCAASGTIPASANHRKLAATGRSFIYISSTSSYFGQQ